MGLIARQRSLQVEAYGEDPYARTGAAITSSMRDNVLACTDELHEALRKVRGWKPWSAAEPYDHIHHSTTEGEEILDELADAQLFLWNLVLNTGASDAEFEAACIKVQDKARRRVLEGYAG